ncbi:MAG: hypothetical protein PUP91_22800 [Rhizonema sp. PD37]|nr:hypothetical protein [Rhizonema sp. PD37]
MFKARRTQSLPERVLSPASFAEVSVRQTLRKVVTEEPVRIMVPTEASIALVSLRGKVSQMDFS